MSCVFVSSSKVKADEILQLFSTWYIFKGWQSGDALHTENVTLLCSAETVHPDIDHRDQFNKVALKRYRKVLVVCKRVA
jgi:hypothetical protein